MNKESKILIYGARGLVGSALVRKLKSEDYNNLLTPTSSEVNLMVQTEVADYMRLNVPDYVFLAAAKVGGILANSTYTAEFIYNNLLIQSNVIHCSYIFGVKKLLFLGSSCIYPKLAQQPLKEECLLGGHLEETNKSYAVAKIAGLVMCDAYRKQYGFNAISAMPTNLYGPGDNFDLKTSHVLPALIRKFHEAKYNGHDDESVTLWGTGTPKREFLHVDDLADALLFLMLNYDESGHINIGTGEDLHISELAQLVQKVTGHQGDVCWDTTKPDGTPRKVLDTSRITNLGWKPKITLEDGIKSAYAWYIAQQLK